jgi:hypothetical protein
MKEVDFNVKMLGSLPYGLLPEYYKQLGKDAEFVYSATFGKLLFRTRETASSLRRTRRSSIALPPCSRRTLRWLSDLRRGGATCWNA